MRPRRGPSHVLQNCRKEMAKVESPLACLFKIDMSVYAEIKWFDEVGPGRQEYKLSQMPADDDWDDDTNRLKVL